MTIDIDAIRIPGQPDGIEYDSHDLPKPTRAARRVRAYIERFGDGVIDTADRRPLYARDLEALRRAALRLADVERSYQVVSDSRDREGQVIRAMQQCAARNPLRDLLWRKPWRSPHGPNLRSIRDTFNWLRNAHDCADPAVGCSCSGGFRFGAEAAR